MKKSKIVYSLMFDYEDMSDDKIIGMCAKLPRKLVRWLGINHPDNKTRLLFYKITGVEIGKDTVINQNFIVSDGFQKLLKIGSRVAISPNVTVICESDSNNSSLSKNKYVHDKLICRKEVTINDDVWVGANSVILPGVTIGPSSIIGAGSLVLEDVPENTIVAGVPAKIIRNI